MYTFYAYKNELDYKNKKHYFKKKFYTHTKLNIFSANHSFLEKKKYVNYVSDYKKLKRQPFVRTLVIKKKECK